ncbi:MAG: hypothetical protein IKN55_10195 [Oscillospiraceae bacterium]|nr:hypothetical protein [Oscillospiraceae bacterium]
MDTSFNIPEESFQTGILAVREQEEYAARKALHDYDANRRVCFEKQKHQQILRICFVVMMMPLFFYFVAEFFQKDLNNYMAIIAACYTAIALPLVLFLKNLRIPAVASLVFCAEMFRLDDWTALIPTLVPIVILNLLAFFYDRNKRFLAESPGFPDFPVITLQIKEQQRLSERDVPAAEASAADPYSDILSAVPDDAISNEH